MQYSDNTVDLLEAAEDINLRHQLNIILDERYRSPSDFDGNYRDAKEASQMTLSMLRDDAREKQRSIEEVLQTLVRVRIVLSIQALSNWVMADITAIQFREQTLRNQRDVKFLTQQYKTGPVENRSDKKTPYLEVLNKDLADSLIDFEKKVREIQGKYTNWVRGTSYIFPVN